MENSNLIRIDTTETQDVFASEADLFVTVEGSSFFTGDQALKKAKEVGQLIHKLSELGITSDDVHLESVRGHVDRGILSTSSSAKYHLRVRCKDLNAIPAVLAAVSTLKSSTLNRIVWQYGDIEDIRRNLLRRCLEKSREVAKLAADVLRTNIVGIRECSIKDDAGEGENPWEVLCGYSHPAGAEGAPSREDIGMDISHSRRVKVQVTVRYLVEGFEK